MKENLIISTGNKSFYLIFPLRMVIIQFVIILSPTSRAYFSVFSFFPTKNKPCRGSFALVLRLLVAAFKTKKKKGHW